MRDKEYYENLGYRSMSDYYRKNKYEDSGYVSPELSSESDYPDYIKSEVLESVKSIQEHQGLDTFTFAFITDIHYATTHNHEIRMKRTINAYKEIAKRVHIDALFLGGDLTNEGCKEYKSDCFRELRALFSNIKYFPINGNHDDGSIWDIAYIEADNATNHLTHEDLYKLFYNHLPSLGAEISGENYPLYYMYNDKVTKTRYVCLDTGDVPYIFDNGKLRYSPQWIFATSQKQTDWLINKALKFDEEGWSVVFLSHSSSMPTKNLDTYPTKDERYLIHINDILDAYKSGVILHKEYYNGDLKISVNADFRNCTKAEIVCIFVGDYHRDVVDYTTGNIPMILTSNSVTYRGTPDRPERNDGDKSEMLFDIATIEKSTRKIHIVRVGCGDDRCIEY